MEGQVNKRWYFVRSVPTCVCVCVCVCVCIHTYIFMLLSFVLIQTKNMLIMPGKKKVTGACICVPTCVFVCVLMCECAYLRARMGAYTIAQSHRMST